MSDTCSAAAPLSRTHLAPAIATAGATITPARHASAHPAAAAADLLVVGRIATGDPAAPTAEAMAVAGGRIVGIGSRADLDALTGPATTTLAPDGVVIPGLIEPHAHIWVSLLTLDWTDVSHSACPRFDDVVAALTAAAAATPAGQYVLAKLFDPSLYPGEPVLTRDILDRVATDRPVIVLNASMHFAYANSAALDAAGITDATPQPVGGTLEKVDGRLTGVVGESPAVTMLLARLPRPTSEDIARGIRQVLTAFASRGVTSMREAMTGTLAGVSEIAMLHALNGAARLPVRVSTAQFSALAGCAGPLEAAAAWKEAGVTPFSGDEMVRADAWKIVADGSNQGRSGYFLQPYLGETSGGHANWTPESLREVMRAGLDDGWQLMIHTNGDAAVEFALRAAEELLPGRRGDLRHRFEHASVTTDDQLVRMAAAGISPSFLMDHVYYWGAAFRDTILGPDRAARLDRLASAVRAGLRPSLHSDYNVTEVHPLHAAQTAVLRRLEADGSVLAPEECATPAQALAAITADAAWQIHADDRGSLRAGMRADFAVVDADPWTSDPAGWDDIAVHATYIDGVPAFSA
ncbi:amidohydrolase [Microbacterium hominis]|uniref:amidohydrolase n=1 Tax=Microbacterium TaxID=33882 RepID=UPI00168A9FCE|nr:MULTISPECIES: amidohydrolase [Microbacterium]QOC24969.1 amidohydrolase [Microbacterium hominis]QOC29017.1 amidohydrolase [Microbacterium hominis]QYF98772.1 amidohydrolase [Microbacterium sp. PAMC21962]